MKRQRIALSVIPSGGAPPGEFRIWAYGQVKTWKGTFSLTRQAAADLVSLSQDGGNDLYIDWEHAHLKVLDGSEGAQSPAAGWFNLEARDDGLYAVNVRWTARAADQLGNGEYRYFSPLFGIDDQGVIVSLINLALTNDPATKNLAPLVAASRSLSELTELVGDALEEAFGECWLIEVFTDYAVFSLPYSDEPMRINYSYAEETGVALDQQAVEAQRQYLPVPGGMTMKNILIALSLAATATEDDATKKVAALVSLNKTAQGLTGETEPAKVEAALMALSQRAGQADALHTRVEKLEGDSKKVELDALIATGRREGKLPPALIEWANTQAPEALRVYLSKAPTVLGTAAEVEGQPAQVVALSHEQRQIADQFGMSHAEFLTEIQKDAVSKAVN
jgi:phage I-like protein